MVLTTLWELFIVLYTADNYVVKMFVYYRNRLLDLLINYIIKLIIGLFVKKILISLFNHIFIVTYIKHVLLKFHTM
jgi:hypothetical protein